MLIDKAAIRRLIPHAGTMCLLDGVMAWDITSIVCVTATHRDTANPLRRQGRLGGLHAFEYGAQAAAVHGSLVANAAGQQAPPAYLAALRDARLYVTYLDDIAVPLEVSAHRLTSERGNCIYQLSVSAAATVLAQGRVIIINRPEIMA
jgi:predicted hotdog family 3-hydroxylacyl-ACP dehydratase